VVFLNLAKDNNKELVLKINRGNKRLSSNLIVDKAFLCSL
jgi:hypothetical protein